MEKISKILHVARAYCEQNGMGNEEAVLARAIRGLDSVQHLDLAVILPIYEQAEAAVWGNEFDKANSMVDEETGEITLGKVGGVGSGPVPGVAKDALYNPLRVSSHSPTFPDGRPPAPPPLEEGGMGLDPSKANPIEVAAESNYRNTPNMLALGRGTTTQTTEQALPTVNDLNAGSPMERGTQGTTPGPRNPFLPTWPSESAANAAGTSITDRSSVPWPTDKPQTPFAKLG